MNRVFKASILLLASCTAAVQTYAQTTARPVDTTRKNKVQQIRQPVVRKGPAGIKNELSFGICLNTNGWSAYTDFGKVKSLDGKRKDMFYKVRLMQLEFTEKKDNSEKKITSPLPGGSGSPKYIYGKINNFYALKFGVGSMRMIAGKPDPGAVSIHWLNVIGVSLGMEKPYYVNVATDPGTATAGNAIKYSETTGSAFLNRNLIQGGGGFSKGLGEMKFIPGGHIKSALHFDFSANRKNVIGAETGLNFEYYSQDISLMANRKGTPYFLDAYVAFQFGKRW